MGTTLRKISTGVLGVVAAAMAFRCSLDTGKFTFDAPASGGASTSGGGATGTAGSSTSGPGGAGGLTSVGGAAGVGGSANGGSAGTAGGAGGSTGGGGPGGGLTDGGAGSLVDGPVTSDVRDAPIITGPQLKRSTPANGDLQASVSQYMLLWFDRPVSSAFATGKISLVGGSLTTPTALAVQGCPDADPTCLIVAYPMSVLVDRLLPGSTDFTVTIDKSFQDADGNRNMTDTVVKFKTFAYNNAFADDSAALSGETGGLDYDPGSNAIFLVGTGSNTTPLVRRVSLTTSGTPLPPTQVYAPIISGGGPYQYGADIYGGRLYAAQSYGGSIAIYSNLSATTLTLVDTLQNTNLTSPPQYKSLIAPISSAAVGGITYISFGHFFGGDQIYDILSNVGGGGATGMWAVWKAQGTLWGINDYVMVYPFKGSDNVQYILVSTSAKLYKFRQSDGVQTAVYDYGGTAYTTQVRTDSKGRIYLGKGGLVVLDEKLTTELARRDGLRVERFGVREVDATTTEVYYVQFRSPAKIGTTELKF
jgi:Big-like domain-containing protein